MATNSVDYLIRARDRFSRNFDKLNRKLKKTETNAEKAARKLKFFKENMKIAGLAIGAFGIASTLAFAKTQKGLADVRGLMSAKEIAQFGGRLEDIQRSALRMGFTIADVNQGLFDTISALGVSDKAFEVFAVSQKLAIAGSADLGVAVDGITSIVNAYGRELVDATEVAETFFGAQVIGKTTVSRLSATIGQVAPIAKAAGIGYKELLVAVSALTLGGLSTEESVTSLKGAFTSLIKPTDDAKKVLTALKIPFGATGLKAANLSKIFERLNIASEKYPDLIARAIPNIRGFTAVAALSGDKLKILEKTLIKLSENTGNSSLMTKSLTDQMTTLDVKIGILRGSFTSFLSSSGKLFEPWSAGFLDATTKMIQGIDNLIVRFNKLLEKQNETILKGVLKDTFSGAGLIGSLPAQRQASPERPFRLGPQKVESFIRGAITVAAEQGSIVKGATFGPDLGVVTP